MNEFFFIAGAVGGGLGVALGAFGAHGLRRHFPPGRLDTFETAVRYQMYHSLALLITSLITTPAAMPWITAAGWLFLGGMLLFSGSLYLLVFTGERRWGAVTPLGGLALIAGWACLVLSQFV